MKIAINELIRIFNRRIFWGLLAAFFIINGVFLFSEQSVYEKSGGDLAAYRQAFYDYRGANSEEKSREIQERLAELETFRQIDFYYQTLQTGESSALPEDFNQSILKQYESREYLQYSDNVHTEYAIFKALEKSSFREEEHQEYIRSMEERAESMLSVSLFAKELSGFEQENIRKTPLDFAVVADVHTTIDISEGVVGFVKTPVTDLLLTVFLFAVCAFLFLSEENRSLSLITRPTVNGRLPYAGAKLTVASVLSVFLTLCFQFANLIIMEWKYGLGDLSRPIQSVEGFMRCNLPISVGNTILLYIGIKLLMMLFLTAFLSFLCVVFKNGVLTCAVTAGIAGLSFVCQISISSLSYLNFLRYLNPVNAISVRNYLTEYANLNFFSIPVSVLYSVVILYSILWITVSVLTLWGYCYSRKHRSITGVFKLLRFCKAPAFLKGSYTNLIFHEAYKILISQKGFLILLAFVFLQINFWQQNNQPAIISAEDAVFQSLCTNLSGGDSTENDRYIASLFEQNQEIDEKIEEVYASTLTETVKEEKVKTLNMKKIPQNVLMRLEAMQENVKNNHAEYIYDGAYTTFLQYTNHDFELNLTASLLILILFSAAYNCEYSTGMSKLLAASFKGRQEVFWTKTGICFFLTIMVYVLSYIPQMLLYVKRYGSPWSQAPLYSIMVLKNVSLEISVTGAILLNYILKLMGLVMVSVITLWLSSHKFSVLYVLLIGGAITILPQLLSAIGLWPINWISLNFLFYQPAVLSQIAILPGVVQNIYYCVYLIVAVFWMIWFVLRTKKRAYGYS